MTTTSRITLRAAYDSNARYIHDEIKCDSIDQPEAQDFIAQHSENYLVVVYDRGDAPNDYNPTWKGVRRNCITNIPKDKWIVQALVFGHSLDKIDPTLTIELTPNQVQGVNDLPGYYARPAYYKDIAGEELTNKYKMWHLFCERPKWEAGKVERTDYKHISTPPEKQYKASYSDVVEYDINDTWRQEIAMEAGMLHGCNAYNDAMNY
jgi:hypothetical protein